MRNSYIASSAKALLKGSSKYPDLHGVVNFKQMKNENENLKQQLEKSNNIIQDLSKKLQKKS